MQPTKTPLSYEDIVRSTVVQPDSSMAPTRAQEQAAREGFRALDDDEQALNDRVVAALGKLGASSVTAEVTRDLVTLMGSVSEVDALRRIEDAVAAVPGVATVHNQVVVGAP